MQLPNHYYRERRLETLVENQTSYTLNNAALHVFETHQHAERVLLQFDQPVLASMLRGKKIMHLRDQQSFNFLPGESLILPSNELMCIDFPEADETNPTRCLAMAIAEEKIGDVISRMNEHMPKVDDKEWKLVDYNFHFTNDVGIYQILQRLLFLFTEDHPSKDLFVDNMLQELIIRILQANARKIYTEQTLGMRNDNRLASVIHYIRENLHQPLSIETLSEKACMSESHFHRVFKNELGVSPVDFINDERIKLAVSLLQDPNRKIKEVYMECGFESRSYFNRMFKRKKKLSPSEYQAKTTPQLSGY
uniref:AraC family transcriptional regulator n=1 Tax=Roseihalotalea indica TaxID=2867963 RepID=A0AA49JED8_9BACT|nr:AraC family transcriptional regulator [Tunicatimonas sp. TK19036]